MRPGMTKHIYELLVKLTELAVDGAEAIAKDADGFDDRLRGVEAQETIAMAQFYVQEFDENYRNGDLK